MNLEPTHTSPLNRRFDVGCLLGTHANSQRIQNYPSSLYQASLERQSCSLLKPLLTSPAHYKAQFFRSRTSSAAMDLGNLVHTLVLEPHKFHSRYVVISGSDTPTPSEAKHLQAGYPGKTLLDEIEFQSVRRLASRVLERSFRGRPFHRYLAEGEPEATIFYDDPATSTPCRVRVDLWHPEFLFDLKTTRFDTLDGFSRNAVNLHYDLQAYMYSFADSLHSGSVTARPFVFIAASTALPYVVHASPAGTTMLQNGRLKYERALALYRACADLDYWPDHGTEEEVEIAPWQAYRPVELAGVGSPDPGPSCGRESRSMETNP